MEENNKMNQTEEKTEKVGFKKKAKDFWAKNGKKVTLGVSALAAIAAAVVVGRKANSEGDVDVDDQDDDTEFDGDDSDEE